MEEKQIKIENEGDEIFGILHLSDNNEDKSPLVILLHGRGGTKTGPAGFFVRAARSLSKEGYSVLRFDFRGSGDSQGKYEDQTTTSMIKDLEKVIVETSNREEINPSSIGLIGHSWGGYVALNYANNDDRVEMLILWTARTYDLEKALGEPWIKEIERKGYFFENDQKVNRKFYEDNLKYNSKKEMKALNIPIGMIYGEFDEIVLPSDGEYLKKNTDTETDMEILETLDHYFSGESNKEQTINLTKKWLQKWL